MKKRQYQVMREAMTTIDMYGINATHNILTETARIPKDVLDRLVAYGWVREVNGVLIPSEQYSPINEGDCYVKA